MAFFFTDEQIAKMKFLIPEVKIPEREHNSPAYLAKEILAGVTINDIKLSGGVITVCRDARTYSYNYYNQEECAKAEKDLQEEINQLFGVNADVDFFIAATEEREPDTPPPMYWGGTETIHYYSLTVKVKLS
ncbi:MAG: hypothetical protein IJX99_02600 [Clostridia bacterium]|nr:hypothetical protein [Clostridia bacterium]